MRLGRVFYDKTLAGFIQELDTGYEFLYLETWLNNPKAEPISLTLPLQKESYTSPVLFPYFDGLIPEGWLLHLSLETWKLNPKDRFGLLLTVCKDPIGVVSIEPEQIL